MATAPVGKETVGVGVCAMPRPVDVSDTGRPYTINNKPGQVELHPISIPTRKILCETIVFSQELIKEFWSDFVIALA